MGTQPGFAVIDVETTGVFTGGSDRVIEIGVVTLDDRYQIESEWETLLRVDRDLGETSIHGITSTMLSTAPVFEGIAAELVELLAGRYAVAHNARFDLAFLSSELTRINVSVGALEANDPLWAIDTMNLARHVGAPAHLHATAGYFGVPAETAHCALGDAVTTARILPEVMRAAIASDRTPRVRQFPDLIGPAGSRMAVHPRRDADRHPPPAGLINRLADALPVETIATSDGEAAYAECLTRAMEDRVLTDDEVRQLSDLAASFGLSQADATRIHHGYLAHFETLAAADGVITRDEQADLDRIRHLLEIPDGTTTVLAAADSAEFTTIAAGMTVCFTGSLDCSIGGERLTRTQAHRHAEAYGLVIAKGVTKKLDLLVVADPESQSTKAKKARSYGTRIIADRAFFAEIGLPVD